MYPLIIEAFTAVSAIFASSVLMILSFAIANQSWIKSRQIALSIMLLPVVTYGITNVISGNIALSLGLVGALSIVRFRNPVKSPLELTALFAAISYGIMATHSVYWPILISVTISGIALFIHFLDLQMKSIFNTSLLSYSFTEGDIDYSVEFTGFSEHYINDVIKANKGIAVSLTICEDEKDNYAFISGNNKSAIESMYLLSQNKVDKRTMNIGL
jgi:hypothetical protein